jgi:hypothetical protein
MNKPFEQTICWLYVLITDFVVPTHYSLVKIYSLRPKIFALVGFCASLLTIRLIRKNCENVIYFSMTCFIIVYILSIS